MSGIVSKFANLRSIEKIRHEKEMLQHSHDEIREQLEEDTKDGKKLPPYIHARIVLNLRMLELKISMADNDINGIRYNSMGKPGDVTEHKPSYCWGCGKKRDFIPE